MRLFNRHSRPVLFALALLVGAGILAAGCGTKASDECTAPDGSTIVINPTSQTWDTGGFGVGSDLQNDWTVKVNYPDGTVMPKACVTISGSLAVPSGFGAYQFQFYPSWTIPNAPVDSGFLAQTDDFGQYTFSTLISGGTGTFKDTIYVRSGTNVGSAVFEVQ